MVGIVCGRQVFELASNLGSYPIIHIAGHNKLPRNIKGRTFMTYLTRLFVLIFLTILCFNAEAAYLDTVKAQELEPTQEEDESIPHAEVVSRLLNFTGKSDEDCSLPCFAEIRPGETTLPEIQESSIDL